MSIPVEAPPAESGGFARWFRLSFLAGVAIVFPLAVTIWLVATFVRLVDHNVLPLLPEPARTIAMQIPGAGIIVAIAALTVLGALAGNFLGRAIVDEFDNLVGRVPLIRSIYSGAKQVFTHVAAPDKRSFQDAVLIEFPVAGCWAIGFITNETPIDIVDPGIVAVYIPHSPVPTSGFLIYAQRDKLKALTITAEQGLKKIISLGAAQDAPPPSETNGPIKPAEKPIS